jgi:hypothetical protein
MGRYINTALGTRWTDDPSPDDPPPLRYSRGCLQALGRMSAKVDTLVTGAVEATAEVVAKAAAFPPDVVEEVGKLLVEGRMIRLPANARLTVRTSVEEVKSKIFGNSQLITHEADQVHTKLLRPLTVLECLEAALIRRTANGWAWSEVAYERMAAAQ